MSILEEEELTALDISKLVSIREKDVYHHILHIEKTLAKDKKKLVITAPECLSCGFLFEKRKSFSPPGRCPACKAQRISRPVFRVEYLQKKTK